MKVHDHKQPHPAFQIEGGTRDIHVTLPPVPDWNGKSERLIAKPDAAFITKAEQSGFSETSDYDETIAWLSELEKSWSGLRLETMGKTAGQRDIKLAIVGHDTQDPEAVRASGKAVILIQAGIHPGEIDGKDAMLMLLRDMALVNASGDSRASLLDDAVILFIPILNVDGYCRFQSFNRINQRGPDRVGWSTNDANLNLNRDFGKLDAPETRAVMDLINTWQPDIYIDTHVTDGADYQYDVTFGHTSGPHGWSPAIARCLEDLIIPHAEKNLTDEGHIPGPLTLAVNDRDFMDGRIGFTANARFSTGMADSHHIPGILVENHSLKPFRQRVLGMYVLLASLIEAVANGKDSLRSAMAADRDRRWDDVPLGWTMDMNETPLTESFRGVRSETVASVIAKDPIPQWTGEPDESPVAVVAMNKPAATARRPGAYILPPHLSDIALRLKSHGIKVSQSVEDRVEQVTVMHLPDAAVVGGRAEFGIVGTSASQVSEGRVRVTVGEIMSNTAELTIPAGSYHVSTDQPLGTLATILLEPESPDSFFQWGFMLGSLENTAYSEPYVLDPLVKEMLDSSPQLARSYEAKLKDDTHFAESPAQQRTWFLQQTPYADERYRRYPIFRLE